MLLQTLLMLAVTVSAGVQVQDTTIRVQEGMRLDLRNRSGQIRVTTWDRDEARVVLNRAQGVSIDVERSGSVIRIRPTVDRSFRDDFDTRRGRRGRFDEDDEVYFTVTVPRYLDLDLSGVETDISVTGVNGDVSAETIEGSVLVRGGSGMVIVSSVEDEVRVEGAIHPLEPLCSMRALVALVFVDWHGCLLKSLWPGCSLGRFPIRPEALGIQPHDAIK